MNIVLLSGGSGQRLWPLSNDIRSKQFIKIFHKEDGSLESMVQRVYRQIKTIDMDATVTIATSKSQVSAIHNQLGENVGISVEPCRRDTFPAIALAAAYLKDVQGVGEEESVVVNELDIPILCMGLNDVVISASPEGILVSDKEQSSYIKPFVSTLDHRVMFAEKSWGSFKIIDIDSESITIKVTLNPGHKMNYHSHKNRDEVWVVISGKGKTVVDGMEQSVRVGDVITMAAGCRHTVIAETELKLIEVQLGEDINVHDKQKFELEY